MTSGRVRLPVLIIGAAVLLGAAVLFLDTVPPPVPASAASTPIARTTGTGTDNACLDRIHRGEGWIDVCWATVRDTAEADPTKDDYVLKLFATYEGLRWAVFASDLVGEPGDGAYAMWPNFDVGAECRSLQVDLGMVQNAPIETLCGPFKVQRDVGTWTQRLTWTCRSCLFPTRDTDAMSMYDAVGVPSGTVPAWDISVDGGT